MTGREWEDLPANARLHASAGKTEDDAREGTTIYVALRMTARPGGATLVEIQKGLVDIGLPHHRAQRLLRWLSKQRGWGFRMDDSGRITLIRD